MSISSSMILAALAFLAVTTTVYGEHSQQLTFYTLPNKTHGDFLGFRHKVADLTQYNSPILENVVETCGFGWWVAYTEKNYLGEAPYVFLSLDDPVVEESCNDLLIGDWTANYSSLRFLGQPILEKESLSIYELTEFRGEEFIVDDDSLEAATLPFPIQSFMTTGSSEWSFFPEQNFQGDPVCYHSYWTMGGVLAIDNFYNGTLGSFRVGCVPENSTTIKY